MKSLADSQSVPSCIVTTCVVVWIEMFNVVLLTLVTYVTTCVVVWIEITLGATVLWKVMVTTCVVVWIEMVNDDPSRIIRFSHHLRGGVD